MDKHETLNERDDVQYSIEQRPDTREDAIAGRRGDESRESAQ